MLLVEMEPVHSILKTIRQFNPNPGFVDLSFNEVK